MGKRIGKKLKKTKSFGSKDYIRERATKAGTSIEEERYFHGHWA
jgi:hypothetical protein